MSPQFTLTYYVFMIFRELPALVAPAVSNCRASDYSYQYVIEVFVGFDDPSHRQKVLRSEALVLGSSMNMMKSIQQILSHSQSPTRVLHRLWLEVS